MSMEVILKYFPGLSERQREQFGKLGELYSWWNERINLVSRKDMENLYERHVLHSLAVAKVFDFMPGTRIMDAGTGGGFPGVPLAIMYPECPFLLVDSTAKKLLAVGEITDALGLDNVRERHCRLEELREKFDFVVGRALSNLPQTVEWVMKNIRRESRNDMANGLIYLKGGDFQEELESIRFKHRVYELSQLFEEEFFHTKKMIHVFNDQ